MRRITLFSALIAAMLAPAAAQAHDTGADFSHAAVFAPLTPLALAAEPGYSDGGVEHVVGHHGFTGGHVAIEGDRLYVGSYGAGMRIFDISDPAAPKPIGQYTPGLRADAPPDAAVFDGREIAVLNGTARTHSRPEPQLSGTRTDRTEFLDVTDPANPELLWTFGPDQVDGESHNGDIVDARRLYLPSGGRGAQGLRIYDLDPLLGETPAAPANLFRGNPTTLWESSPYRGDKPVGPAYTHTHDLEVYTDYPVEGLGPRDIVLLAEGGNYTGSGNTGSIFVIDVTDPANPVVLLRWLHATADGHHPIRYFHEIQFVDGLPGVALVTDEDLHNGCGNAGGITAIQFAPNLQSATELSEWFIPLGTPAPVCSVHVFSSRNGYVALGSYNAGLQIVDYTEPTAPKQAGFFIAPGTTAWGALIHGEELIYVGDMSRGLDVFRFEGFPADPDPDPDPDPDDKPKKDKKPKKKP